MSILKEFNPLAIEHPQDAQAPETLNATAKAEPGVVAVELSDREEVFMTQLAKRIAAAIFATPLSEQIHFFATAIVAFAIATACLAGVIIVPVVVIMRMLAH